MIFAWIWMAAVGIVLESDLAFVMGALIMSRLAAMEHQTIQLRFAPSSHVAEKDSREVL